MEAQKLKPSFTLFITIILITILFLLSYSIVQSNILGSNLNKLKYMNLQATIHYEYIKKYIQEHTDKEIEELTLDDDRFSLKIETKVENNTKSYYVVIEARDDIPIRLSEIIIK